MKVGWSDWSLAVDGSNRERWMVWPVRVTEEKGEMVKRKRPNTVSIKGNSN